MRLLVINVFFNPLSFGGATIVAEEMAQRLHDQHGFELTSLSIRTGLLPCASIVRHGNRFGFESFTIGISEYRGGEPNWRNLHIQEQIGRVLGFVEPDVVHVHCVQEIGAAFFDILVEQNIPFVVTVHDAWWQCERQFQIDPQGHFCDQMRVDFDHCAMRCSASRERWDYLRKQLLKANLILTPSEYWRRFLISNGVPPKQVVTNKNGVHPPTAASRAPRIGGPVVFGYVGGPGVVKGWELIVEAMQGIRVDQAEIHAIDAGVRIGQSWRDALIRTSQGIPLKVVPSYTQATIDEAFGSFDALLMPSNWKESFGLTAREALLRDVWVIASDAGGLSEDIVDGANGRLLPFPPTARHVRKAIDEVLECRPPRPLPYKSKIRTLDEQGRELAGLLRKVRASQQKTTNME